MNPIELGLPVGPGPEDVEVLEGMLPLLVEVGGETPPLHVWPLKVKLEGTGLFPDHEPVNPKLILAPVAMLPFQTAFWAVTCAPLWEIVVPQA